ncbi:hypothetical protein [uncultured Clostridium sp.]|uniref:hypothetical protein n=1 Tax=uncultured Clostridium sp. TaxID=59620 RepID=UPI0028EC5FF2|nr:hypothetical protein [uncultured Clostridium sp.]
MRKKIIAAIVGISMLMSFNPVFAKDSTNIKSLNNINLEEESTTGLSHSSPGLSISKANLKLDKSKTKLNEDSSKSRKEKVKSKSNAYLNDSKTTTEAAAETYVTDEADDIVDTTTGPAATINDSPENAYDIELSSAYQDTMTSEGAERWYVFQNSFIQKLTAILQAPNSPNVNYELYLYKLNEQTGNLEFVAGSAYGTGYENLSALGQKGYYYLKVSSVEGFDAENPFIFEVMTSDKYGANEPDDNIWEAKPYSKSLSIEDTIDNDFDEDWSSLKLDSDTNGTLSFQNSSTKGNYEVLVYDSTLSLVATLKNNDTLNKKFPAGTYYMRVLSLSGSDPNATYKLNFVNKDSIITSATVTNISSDADGGNVDYGYGKFWRVHYSMTVQGTAYNQYGKPVANQPIGAGTVLVINNKPCTGTAYTDANGNFSINVTLGPAAGQYVYNTGMFTHYFDIIPFNMASSNGVITTNVSYLYHFAYSIYN